MPKRNRIDIELNTMAGDVRDSVLGLVRSFGKTWAAMSEPEQRLAAERAFNLGREIAVKATEAVAGGGYESLTVAVGKFEVTDKGGLKGTFTVGEPEDATLSTLLAMRGRAAVLVAADASEYTNARRDVAYDLDQKVLDLDEEGGEEEEEGEAGEPHPLVDQTVLTPGGNEGRVIFVYPQGEGDELRAKLLTNDGAEIEGVVAEVFTGEVDGVQMWAAVADWLSTATENEAQPAAEAEFAPSGIFEVGEMAIVPLGEGKTAPGEIIAIDGDKYTVKTRAGSELTLSFNDLDAVNPKAPEPEAEPETKPKGKKKPKSPAAVAAADMAIGA